MRIGMVVEYDGTSFHGWQVQPGRMTVQESVERALATVLREEIRVEAAGRTDAGVHAKGQVIAFSSSVEPDLDALVRSVNALCAPDIAAQTAHVVADDFDPRRSAVARTYEYRIRNHAAPSPFSRRYAWHVREPLDAQAMAEAAAILVGEHDFSSFQASDCDADNPVRRVDSSDFVRNGEELVYRVTATAFLRHMVRNIVGTVAEVGRGERKPAAFARLLEVRDRRQAGATAPAHGLCLVAVHYRQGVLGGEGAGARSSPR